MSRAFARGTVALGLHPSSGDAPQVVDVLVSQAVAAEAAGFDGVTMSEHHGGFPTYLPVPTMMAARLLGATATLWAAPCPSILPLRHPASVVEDLAWLAAAYPSRVGAGFVPGYQRRDFEAYGMAERFDTRLADFAGALGWVTSALSGHVDGLLAGDPAISALRERPVPVLVGTGGRRGVERAARAGAGLLVTSQTTAEGARSLVGVYRQAGGTGPCVLVRRAWVGRPPASMAHQLASYVAQDTGGVLPHRSLDEMVLSGEPEAIAQQLADDCEHSGVDGLNLRIFAPDAPAVTLFEQITAVGGEVLPTVRRRLGWRP